MYIPSMKYATLFQTKGLREELKSDIAERGSFSLQDGTIRFAYGW